MNYCEAKITHITTFRPWNGALTSQRPLELLYPHSQQGQPPSLTPICFVWLLALYKTNHIICSLLCLASFAHHLVKWKQNLDVVGHGSGWFSLLCSSPLGKYTIIYFFLLLLREILVISCFGLLQIMLPWTFYNMSFDNAVVSSVFFCIHQLFLFGWVYTWKQSCRTRMCILVLSCSFSWTSFI